MLNLSDEQLNKIIGAAVLQALTQENRDLLIQKAIEQLITPVKNKHFDSPAKSPLQEQFENAVTFIARDMVKEKLKNDSETVKKLEEIISEAFEKIIVTDRKLTVDAFADAISVSLKEQYGKY